MIVVGDSARARETRRQVRQSKPGTLLPDGAMNWVRSFIGANRHALDLSAFFAGVAKQIGLQPE
jgi:hypothetical protein